MTSEEKHIALGVCILSFCSAFTSLLSCTEEDVSFTAETPVLVEAKPLHSEALKVVLTGHTIECECVWGNPGLGFTMLDYSYARGWLDKKMSDCQEAVHSCALIALPRIKVHAPKVFLLNFCASRTY